jgi:membrane fusion protein (multidrug efflux system)
MKKVAVKKYLKMVLPAIIVGGILWLFFIREKNNTVTVRKVELKDRVVLRTVTASGAIESRSQADLSFQSTGKVVSVNVKQGDEVKKGQLLAYMDTSSQSQTVKYYKDALDIKIRQRDLFLDDYKANKDLLGGDKRYNLKLKEYDEGVTQAEAAYQAQVALVSNSYIYAPFNGIAVEVNKEAGETAAISETVVTVADLNNLVFKTKIDQEDYGLLKEGQDAEIKLDSYSNEVFKGKVLKLPYFANASTEQFEIEILVEPKEAEPLRIGMKGDAYVILETSGKEVPTLTVDDVSYDEADKPYVWVLNNGKIKIQPVEFGVEGDIYIEIKTNIAETILVSSKESQKMVEGYTTKIIN